MRALVVAMLLSQADAPSATVRGTDAGSVLGAPLLPEGSPWNAPGTIEIGGFGQFLTFDLRRPTRVGALLLQADGDDVYFIEGSADAREWTILWRVPPVPAPGLRTRTVVLDSPRTVPYLRVRAAQGAGGLSFSRLRAYEAVPSPWPPPLDYSIPGSGLPLIPFIERHTIGPLREVLAVLGLLALSWSALAVRHPGVDRPRLRRAVLGAVTALALLSWWNFMNFRFPDFTHRWELFHYYVGAKYFPELGYTGLYECAAVADAQAGLRAEVEERRLRDLRTNRISSTEEILRDPQRCTARFGTERWESFRRDAASFRQQMGPGAWTNAQMDHGFNATPVWTLLGRFLAETVPSSPPGLTLLAAIDSVLLLLLWVVVGRSFGFEAACAAALYFSLNSLSRFAWTGGAFLRYDWLFAAVAGICALRRGHEALGGAALTYAALLRVFPGCLIAGIALRAAAEVATARSLRPLAAYRKVVLGGLVTAGVMVPLSILAFGGRAWPEFRANSGKYLGTEAVNLVGLSVTLSYRPAMRQELTVDPLRPDTSADWTASQREADARSRPLALLLAGGFLVLLAATVRRHPLWAAAVLGAGLLPVGLKMANYYYGLLSVYGLLWGIGPALGVGLVGLAWASNLVAELLPAYDERSVWISALVCAFVLAATVIAWRTPSRRDT